LFAPQHLRAPAAPITAHETYKPVEIADTPEPKPATAIGLVDRFCEPSPSSPKKFEPQHFTPPPGVNPHVCHQPPLSAVNNGVAAADAADATGPPTRSGRATTTGTRTASGPANDLDDIRASVAPLAQPAQYSVIVPADSQKGRSGNFP